MLTIGAKVVGLMPLTTPQLYAQVTASVYQALPGTS